MQSVWLAWNAEYAAGVVATSLSEVEAQAAQVEHVHGYEHTEHALRALGWVFQEVHLHPDC